jgi:hypothetical protein
MASRPEFGLLIDCEYGTGCHTCQVACAQEYGWPAGMGGIRVNEIVQQLPERKSLPDLPALSDRALHPVPAPHQERTPAGLRPALHGGCMQYGRIEDLAREMTKKPGMVLWVPK